MIWLKGFQHLFYDLFIFHKVTTFETALRLIGTVKANKAQNVLGPSYNQKGAMNNSKALGFNSVIFHIGFFDVDLGEHDLSL